MNKYRVISALAVMLVVLASVWACGNKGQRPEGALARVDGEYITANDLAASGNSLDAAGKRLVGSSAGADRLDLVIERRAMLHQAMKLNLHKDPDFLKAIQKYWEYALLSRMLDQKKRETEATVNITDQELDGYIQDMRYRLKYRRRAFTDRPEAQSFAALCASGKGDVPSDEVSVLCCEGMDPAFAGEISRMDAGEVHVIKKGGEFIVVKMLSKDNAGRTGGPPPREEVRKYALEMKRAAALDDWIASVVKASKVEKYNNDMVAK